MPRMLIVVLATSLIACGVPEERHAAALAEVDSLRALVDDLENGADRLAAQVRRAAESGSHQQVVALARNLAERHPESAEAAEAETLAATAKKAIEAAAAEQARRAEQERRAKERRSQQAVASLWSHTDDVEGVTWYYDRQSSRYVNNRSRVILFMSRRGNGRPHLLFSVRYKADDWLFIERLTFNIDGNNRRLAFEYGEVERDNGSGGIWEWYTTSAGDSELSLARAIMNSDRTVVRYHGQQYYNDRTVTDVEKRGLRNVLEAYEALGGK